MFLHEEEGSRNVVLLCFATEESCHYISYHGQLFVIIVRVFEHLQVYVSLRQDVDKRLIVLYCSVLFCNQLRQVKKS